MSRDSTTPPPQIFDLAVIQAPTRSHPLLLASSLLLFVLLPDVALAGKYELIEGKGVEVCKVYTDNLNSLGATQPMICEREINEKYTNLKKPVWIDLDLTENSRLLANVRNFLRGLPQEKESASNNKAATSQIGAATLKSTSIDIDNDGATENVLQYQNAICGQAVLSYATVILVRKDESEFVDAKKSKFLLTEGNEDIAAEPREKAFNYLFNMYGAFTYKGQTFLDRWNLREPSKDILRVYQASGNSKSEVCVLRYRP